MTLKKPHELVRRTLNEIEKVPSPKELYQQLIQSKGWNYKTNMEFYLKRDRAIVSIIYLAASRISEAIPLRLSQFKTEKKRIVIEGMLLAKRKPGKVKYREAWLPLKGSRAVFTDLVIEYLEALKKEDAQADRLFPWSLRKVSYPIKNSFYTTRKGVKMQRYSIRLVGTNRAWNVIKALLPEATAHWLRQYGDDYLYDAWDHDIMAVSDYTKQDARTLQVYLRKRYQKYKSV